jgi:hypothetical protein
LDKGVTITGAIGEDTANIKESRRLITMCLKVAIGKGIK